MQIDLGKQVTCPKSYNACVQLEGSAFLYIYMYFIRRNLTCEYEKKLRYSNTERHRCVSLIASASTTKSKGEKLKYVIKKNVLISMSYSRMLIAQQYLRLLLPLIQPFVFILQISRLLRLSERRRKKSFSNGDIYRKSLLQ